MPKPTRIWQLISLSLALALIAVLGELHRITRSAAPGTLPTVNSATNLEHLALSPNARRVHERYSL
ncbi:hypothetical protein [Pseudomonas asiatica]|uniref:Uncharacterized protein n=1 Tax=Pseudomonas asiatica TaxID=2219225 RepID=A0ABU5L4G9_9PSED|nr:hypothetical protein [Pseudomonas asiatica]MDZ5741035.1 hypothetical protein [Pseudomonas asiatica]MDZ5745936.1 hypothetical protein [Pseudomonas asiatica]MDZ5750510.1 hypothetical protein [Pseudomonas asiatica]MDZ5756392.1 hypothetical protein [Pseudomonas asiatica]